MAQQLADVSLELARMQYQYAVVVSYVVYTILAVTAVIIFYALLESRPEDKKITSSQYDLLKVMISSESAHRRKAISEQEATIGAVRTMVIGYKALHEKDISYLDKQHDEFKKKADRNFKVLDKRTKKKPRLKQQQIDKIKEVGKQVTDFDSLTTEEDKERAFNWMISDRINNR